MKRLSQYGLFFVLSTVCLCVAQAQTFTPNPPSSKLYSLRFKEEEKNPVCQAFMKLLETKYAKRPPSPCEPFEKDIPGVSFPEWEEVPMAQQEDFDFTTNNIPDHLNRRTPIKRLNEGSDSPVFVRSPYQTDYCWQEYQQKESYFGRSSQYFRTQVSISDKHPPVTIVTYFYPLNTCERKVRLYQAEKGFKPIINGFFYVFDNEKNTLQYPELGNNLFILNGRTYIKHYSGYAYMYINAFEYADSSSSETSSAIKMSPRCTISLKDHYMDYYRSKAYLKLLDKRNRLPMSRGDRASCVDIYK